MFVNSRILVNLILPTFQYMYTQVWPSGESFMNCVAPNGLKLASPDLEFQISQALTAAIQRTVGTLRYSNHIKVCHYCRT
jgi:hypothetical protein